MDERIREHAETIADHSTDMGQGDRVVISAPPVASDLAEALHAVAGERGAEPVYLCGDSGARRAFLRARAEADTDTADEDATADAEPDFETPDHELALVEATDVYVAIRADANATELSDVDPATTAAAERARQPVREARLDCRWCLTQYPAPGNAQLAELSTAAYEEFVWNAIAKDWDAQRAHQQRMVDRMGDADTVRIVSGDETDIELSIAGSTTLNDYGEKNLPGGEVFTAPIPESVEGTVHFDMPLYHQGREVEDVRLTFEDGAVVDHAAAKNADLLTEVLNTDDGARRLGELGIGMNRDIDRFTYNMLFDEKMGDTVHLAIGMAYDECVPDDREPNESAVHLDMIVDMSEDSRIELDGEVVQRDGTFVFEEGFEPGA
jgi:aminopeptidase